MSDRIAVMRQGRVEQVGSPEVLYDQPQTAFVASFFGSSTLLKGSVRTVKETSVASTMVTVRVQVGDVQLDCLLPANVPAAPDTPLTLSIRPERVHCLLPGQSAQPGWNTLDGVVNTTFFHGSVLRVQLDVGQVSLSCDLGRQQAHALALTAGQKIRLAIAPEDIVVLSGSIGD